MEDITNRQGKDVVEEHGNQMTPTGDDDSISQSHQGGDNPQSVIEKLLEMNRVLLEHYAAKGGDPSKLPPMPSLPKPGTSMQNPETITLPPIDPPIQTTPVKFSSQTSAHKSLTSDPIIIAPSSPLLTKAPATIPSSFITAEEVQKLLKAQADKAALLAADLDFSPPYPLEIAEMPYPEGYTPPKFRFFDGKRGNPQEHVRRFVEQLGVYGNDKNLRLREFSKSLTDKAYSWYGHLAPGSVSSWEDLLRQFCTKFFQTEEAITAHDLQREKQRPNENLNAFIKRFRERSLECHEALTEANLIDYCVEGILPEYRIHLVNLKHQTFREFAEAARKVYEVVAPLTTRSPPPHNSWSKNNHRGGGSYSSRKSTASANVVERKRHDHFKGGNSSKKPRDDNSLEYPCSLDEAVDLYQQLLADGIVSPPTPRSNPTEKDKTNPKFCIFHQYVGHPTRDCHTLKKIINEHHSDGTPVPQKDDVNRNPFPNHKGKKGVHVISADDEQGLMQASEVMIVQDDKTLAMPAIEKLATYPKFKWFYDQIGLSQSARIAATEAIARIAQDNQNSMENWSGPLKKMVKSFTSSVTFSEADRQIPYFHNRPLYVAATINGKEFKRALLDFFFWGEGGGHP